MTAAPLHQTSFTLERRYAASPARVFAAWASAEKKTRWFHGPPGTTGTALEQDFRPGGSETVTTVFPDGEVHRYHARFSDIVPDQRIVLTYEMALGDVRISVSLMTVEIFPDGGGSRLVFNEHAVFLNGFEDGGGREHGSGYLLDSLGAMLAGSAS